MWILKKEKNALAPGKSKMAREAVDRFCTRLLQFRLEKSFTLLEKTGASQGSSFLIGLLPFWTYLRNLLTFLANRNKLSKPTDGLL